MASLREGARVVFPTRLGSCCSGADWSANKTLREAVEYPMTTEAPACSQGVQPLSRWRPVAVP
jgi:hypothetical protein